MEVNPNFTYMNDILCDANIKVDWLYINIKTSHENMTLKIIQ
jgi:hypothetical protein